MVAKDASKEVPKPTAEAMKKPEPVAPPEITKHIDEIMRRIRLLEDRYSGLGRKSQFSEQNMLKDYKELTEEISLLNSGISELKADIAELSEKMLKLTDEVNSGVTRSEFSVLAKYLEFWQPLNFLTRKEADELIKDAKEKS